LLRSIDFLITDYPGMKPRLIPAAGAPGAGVRARCWRQWLVIALLASPLVSRGAFFLQAEGRFLILQKEVSYRSDLAPTTPIEEVMAVQDGWVAQSEKPFLPSPGSIHLWARFTLPEVSEPRQVLLDTGAWEDVEYYFVQAGRVVDHQRVGTLVPLSRRAVQVTMTWQLGHAGYVSLELRPGLPLTVFARLASEQQVVRIPWLKFHLWDPVQVRAGEKRDRTFQCIYLGVMLVLVAYNLALYFVIRERSYLYYVISVVGGAFIAGWFFGLTSEFLWPSHPLWDAYSVWIGTFVSCWGGCQFVRHYLDTGKILPRADVALKWMGVVNLALIPIVFLLPVNTQLVTGGTPILAWVTVGWVVAVMAQLVRVIVQSLACRHPLARFFLMAVLISASTNMVTGAAILGLLPLTDFTMQVGQVGTCCTGIILSLGLGFRVQRMRADVADRQLAHERDKRELAEEHNRGLETKVRERTAELMVSQEKSDALLANILPQAIIEELTATGETEPRRHEEVSMLFTDFAGFTQTVATIPPKRLVQELDEIFRGFDDIVAAHGLEKIKTIGDAYMTAAGLPLPATDHAVRSVRAALALTRFIETRNETAAMKWGLRVGIHSGAVVAGIVGKHKYAYDVWGDTVNIASRLESASESGRVNVSAYTYELVRDHFVCEYRGKLAAKGKGAIDMYFVLRENDGASRSPS
jgi:class 3 adenylate cyclase